MADNKPVIIDGEYQLVPANARLSDVVGPEVQSVLTYEGIIDRDDFDAVPLPDGFERQIGHVQKG
jgi:hypothetical protein